MTHISNKNGVKKILIDGDLNSDGMKKLIDELSNEKKDILFEIIFIDSKYISSELLRVLNSIKNQAKISTTQRTLWSYLTKMGIKNHYQNNLKNLTAPEHIKAVGIGGSANSLEKLIPLITALPYCDISVFITIHLMADKKSHLVEILQKVTNYKVCEVMHNTKIEKNTIYIAPPNNHIMVTNGFIYLSNDSEISFARPSIDVLFKSLAYEYKNSLLTILLCGYGSDGANSLQDLKEQKSEIIIIEPNECEAKDMPIQGIKTKNYFKILNLKNMQNYLKTLFYTNIDIEEEIEHFLESLYLIYGFDFRDYERKSIIRRIEYVMKDLNIKKFKQFEKMILADNYLFDKLIKSFSINVTEFFRNPQTYKEIKEEILPYIESFPSIRVWCAGCSSGEEPYSIAMMLDEAGILGKTQIYATDFNDTILNEAQNGIYPINLFKKFKNNYIQSSGKEKFEKWFDFEEKFVEIKQELKDKILFFNHNLVTDGSINEFHLVFCRNVLIYFDKVLQKRVFQTIDESLFRDAFLVLGESEIIDKRFNYNIIGQSKSKIYHKRR